MRSFAPSLLLACLLVPALSAASATVPASATAPAAAVDGIWNPDVAQALADGAGRPKALLISSAGCVWCERLKGESQRHAGVKAAMQEVVGIELRADLDRGMAMALEIRSLPTLILVNRKNRIVRRIPGYLPSDDLAAALRVLAASGDKEEGEGELPDPTAGIADALASEDPTARLVVMVGDGTAERRAEIRRLLMLRPDAAARLWPLLEDRSLSVRVDAASILSAQVGFAGGYDAFEPPATQQAAVAAWRASATAAGAVR